MNFYAWQTILYLVEGKVSGAQAGRMIERMIADTGLEPILKSWIILDNHDLPRLKTALPEQWQQRMAQVLQFTLPGCPCVYYGVEVGMEGGDAPENRGPMRWDLVSEANEDLCLSPAGFGEAASVHAPDRLCGRDDDRGCQPDA